MQETTPIKRRRGRPPKNPLDHQFTRELLLRSGMELLTEKGYSATGIEEILRPAKVPKGSFYHYFASKDAFTKELIDYYGRFFRHLLNKHLTNPSLSPLERLAAFMQGATDGMARHQFRRGCLIGNLGQETRALPEGLRPQLQAVLLDWQRQVEQCLVLAQLAGEIGPNVNTEEQAYLFWLGWEGAVLRAKLDCNERPLQLFSNHFLTALKHA